MVYSVSSNPSIFTSSSFTSTTITTESLAPSTVIAPPHVTVLTSTQYEAQAPFPLTTIFTPPSNCWDGPWSSSDGTASYLTLPVGVASSCSPPVTFTQGGTVWDSTYSPGVCPASYSMQTYFTQSNAASSITTGICCPPWMQYNQASSSCTAFGATLTQSDISTASTYLFPTLEVQWQSSDLNAFTPISAPLGTTFVAASTPSSTQISLPNDQNSGGQGLSSGATGEIAGGVVAGVILILGIIGAWLLMRRRKRKELEHEESSFGSKTVEHTDKGCVIPRRELGVDGQISEMDGKGRIAEVDARSTELHELDGTDQSREQDDVKSPTDAVSSIR